MLEIIIIVTLKGTTQDFSQRRKPSDRHGDRDKDGDRDRESD